MRLLLTTTGEQSAAPIADCCRSDTSGVSAPVPSAGRDAPLAALGQEDQVRHRHDVADGLALAGGDGEDHRVVVATGDRIAHIRLGRRARGPKLRRLDGGAGEASALLEVPGRGRVAPGLEERVALQRRGLGNIGGDVVVDERGFLRLPDVTEQAVGLLVDVVALRARHRLPRDRVEGPVVKQVVHARRDAAAADRPADDFRHRAAARVGAVGGRVHIDAADVEHDVVGAVADRGDAGHDVALVVDFQHAADAAYEHGVADDEAGRRREREHAGVGLGDGDYVGATGRRVGGRCRDTAVFGRDVPRRGRPIGIGHGSMPPRMPGSRRTR
jgi:hypothetical protein